MKKILYIVIVAAALSSCKAYLEVEPTNVFALTTYDDVKALLGGYLRKFTTSVYSANNAALKEVYIPFETDETYHMFSILADDLDMDRYRQNNSSNKLYLRESLNWKNPRMAGVLWKQHFSNIGFLNTIIAEVDKLPGGTAEERDIVRCEAKFLRAWNIFKLTQYFSPYALNDYGIPLNTDPDAVETYDSGRKKQTEIYNIIIDDLNEVLKCATDPRETYNIFYDKMLVNALLAQVYLYKGASGGAEAEDYDNAIQHAKAVVDQKPILSLADYSPFPQLQAGKYGVFKTDGPALATLVTYNSWSGMYWMLDPFTKQFPRPETFALYTNDDVRKNAFFNTSDNSIKKYGSLPEHLIAFNFFHTADMHLTVAEAYARSNRPDDARQWLESFQRERYNGYTGYAGSDLLEEILDERRREFFLEGDVRWTDLARLQTGWSRNSYMDPESATYTLEDGDFRFAMPIPLLEELQYNKIDQNPGWGLL